MLTFHNFSEEQISMGASSPAVTDQLDLTKRCRQPMQDEQIGGQMSEVRVVQIFDFQKKKKCVQYCWLCWIEIALIDTYLFCRGLKLSIIFAVCCWNGASHVNFIDVCLRKRDRLGAGQLWVFRSGWPADTWMNKLLWASDAILILCWVDLSKGLRYNLCIGRLWSLSW